MVWKCGSNIRRAKYLRDEETWKRGKWRDEISTDETRVRKLHDFSCNKIESDGFILCMLCSVALLGFSALRASNHSGCP